MEQVLEFLLHHIEMVVFFTVLAEQIGLPLPAIPVLLAAGAEVSARRARDRSAHSWAHRERAPVARRAVKADLRLRMTSTRETEWTGSGANDVRAVQGLMRPG